jgi:hypothetical protein
VTDSNEVRIQVIYSAVHPRCGRRIARTHPKIYSHADLNALYADVALKGKVQTIELYCHYCAESFEPTHIEIIEDGKIIVPEMEIDKFNPLG